MVLSHFLALSVCHAYFQAEPWLPNQESQQRIASLQAVGVESSNTDGHSDFPALLQEVLPRFRIDPGSVPALFQEQLRKRLQEFSSLYQETLQSMFQRARAHLPMIKLILQRQNVPSYFAFLPLVESGFQPQAEHPDSGARGLWQLLPETARTYGLQVSPAYDERLHPIRSTQAAAHYLRELHDMFGTDSPLLILAAYNLGEQTLAKAIIRARTRDIWALFQKRQIPYQTRDYLVKMVAFWILIAQADRLQLPLELVEPPKATEVSFLHRATLTRPTSPMVPPAMPWQEGSTVPLPSQVLACAPGRILPISIDRCVYTEEWPSEPLTSCCPPQRAENACWHTVEAGESLWTIAQRYALDVATLKVLNQLGGAKPVIRPGQRLLTCPAALPELVIAPNPW
jgi:membrane-bound lytic murein transglycosylase D